MRMLIDHRTRYSFSEPQARVVQLLRMTPSDGASQTIIDWAIEVDCDARLRHAFDGYGNATTMLYVDGPVTSIEIVVQGEVLIDNSNGVIVHAHDTLPPLIFTRSTPLTASNDEITAFARRHATPDALATALHARVATRTGRTPKSRTPAESFAEGWGSVRDCAQLLVAAARSIGMPARFVSGHCLDAPNARTHKSAHCWAEIFEDGIGWIALDPSSGMRTADRHLRVAIGLDASDATPLSGTRRGGGIEELDVAVHIAMAQSQS